MVLEEHVVPPRHTTESFKDIRLHGSVWIAAVPVDDVVVVPNIYAGDVGGGHTEQALREPPGVSVEEERLELVAHGVCELRAEFGEGGHFRPVGEVR